MEKLLGQRLAKGPSTIVKITALTLQNAVLPWQEENSQECWDAVLHASLSFTPVLFVSLHP